MCPGTKLPLHVGSTERHWRRNKTSASLTAARTRIAIGPLGNKCLVLPGMIFKADAALESAIRLCGLTQAGLGRFLVFHSDKRMTLRSELKAIETPNDISVTSPH